MKINENRNSCLGSRAGVILGHLGSNMFKRSCLRGNSGFLFEHVGSNESLDVLVPQSVHLVLWTVSCSCLRGG